MITPMSRRRRLGSKPDGSTTPTSLQLAAATKILLSLTTRSRHRVYTSFRFSKAGGMDAAVHDGGLPALLRCGHLRRLGEDKGVALPLQRDLHREDTGQHRSENQQDRRTGQPKIWIYRDKITNEPKGDATVTYEDPHAALAAMEWFHNKDFHGSIIEVYMAQLKTKDSGDQSYGQQVNHVADPAMDDDLGGQDDVIGGGRRGRGRGNASTKAWQQDEDWLCPNISCANVNFAFRGGV